jgi:AAA ATPase domain
LNPIPIFGRDNELDALRRLVARRHSFLLHGPAGVGKTLLLTRVVGEASEMIYCRDSSSRQAVFRTLASELIAKGSSHVVKALGKGGIEAIANKSAVSLRGIVTEALRLNHYWIVLDHVKSPTQSYAAALKDACNSTCTPLIAVARSDHMEDAGYMLPMFCERSAKFALADFDATTAKEFAATVAQEMRLEVLNRDEVIEKVVHYSKGNPGAIVALLQMAVSPKYRSPHLKFFPLYIDFKLGRGATHG